MNDQKTKKEIRAERMEFLKKEFPQLSSERLSEINRRLVYGHSLDSDKEFKFFVARVRHEIESGPTEKELDDVMAYLPGGNINASKQI